MMDDFGLTFFAEVLVGSLLSGVVCSLVVIDFVLIYETPGMLNFAQGVQLLFAALTFISLLERGVPFPLALLTTLTLMALLGLGIERVVLRPLVNQPFITLFMATLGLSYVIEGVAQLAWDAQVHALNLGISDAPLQVGGILVSSFDLFVIAITTVIMTALSAFFRYARIGLTFHAVADDAYAAIAVGLQLPRIWATVWTAAGVIALVAGLLQGAHLGVQFSLPLAVLKTLPVLVLGSFDSILDTVVSGLITGAPEKLAEVYLRSFVGGGIESWITYVAAPVFLLVKLGGLFGLHPAERA